MSLSSEIAPELHIQVSLSPVSVRSPSLVRDFLCKHPEPDERWDWPQIRTPLDAIYEFEQTNLSDDRQLQVRPEQKEWEAANDRRMDLIHKKVAGTLLPEEFRELDMLQEETDARIHRMAPLPIRKLERLREELKRKGIWEGE